MNSSCIGGHFVTFFSKAIVKKDALEALVLRDGDSWQLAIVPDKVRGES